MSPQRQFEGPDVRVLLDEICSTYGTEPTISKAETFRTGGILGFFQREHYRLVVNAPAGAVIPAGARNEAGAVNPAETKKGTVPVFSRKGLQSSRKAAANGPRQRTGTPKPAHTAALAALASSPPPLVLPEPEPSVQDMAVRTYSTAAAAAYSAAASATASPSGSADEMTASEFLESLDEGCWATGHATDPFESVAASTADDDVVLTSVRPAVEKPAQQHWASSPTGEFPSFEEVLRKVASAVDAPQAEVVEWPRAEKADPARAGEDGVSWGGAGVDPAVSFPSDRIRDAVAELELYAAAPAALALTASPAGEPCVAPVGADPIHSEEDNIVAIADGRTASVFRKPETESEPIGRHAMKKPAASLADRLSGDIAEPHMAPAPARTASAPAHFASSREGTAAVVSEATRRQARRLLATGLDAKTVDAVMAATGEGWSLEASILDAMEDQPLTQVPRQTGSLVVVIGPRSRAAQEATRIAAEVGADPARVALATDRRPAGPVSGELLITSAAQAGPVATSLCEGTVGVIAMEAPTGSRATTMTWARLMLDALNPTHVIAIVDSMHKNDDIAAWITGLGGVDALVVDHAELTSSPARILKLGLPVSRLGSHAATPARWAATILDCLGEDGPLATEVDVIPATVIDMEIAEEMPTWA